jgi:hypothetical protein
MCSSTYGPIEDFVPPCELRGGRRRRDVAGGVFLPGVEATMPSRSASTTAQLSARPSPTLILHRPVGRMLRVLQLDPNACSRQWSSVFGMRLGDHLRGRPLGYQRHCSPVRVGKIINGIPSRSGCTLPNRPRPHRDHMPHRVDSRNNLDNFGGRGAATHIQRGRTSIHNHSHPIPSLPVGYGKSDRLHTWEPALPGQEAP